MWILTNGLCKPSLEIYINIIKFYTPKMGKKLTSSNRYISIITDIDDKWFVVFEHTINHLSFGYVCLPQLEQYFFCFASFFLLFFSSLNALYKKFERLKISGSTSVQLNQGCQVGGIPLNRVLQNFKLLPVRAKWIKFSEWVEIKNKLNVTKIGGVMIGVSFKRPSKI